MIALIIFFSLIILGSVVLGVIALLSKFTEVASGTYQFAIHGEKYVKTLTDKLFKSIWGEFGKIRVGFGFLNYDVKSFSVNVDKKNVDKATVKDDDPNTWVVKREPRMVNHLRKKMERFLVVANAELGGTQPLQVNAGFAIIFEADEQRGYEFVFNYNADFDNPVSVVTAAVRAKIATIDRYQTLVTKPQSFFDEILNDKTLVASLIEYGLKLTQIKLEKLTTDRSVEEAARKKLIAELEFDAATIDATKIEALGNAEANVIMAKAKAEIDGKMKGLGRTLTSKEKAEILVGLMTADALKNTKVTNLTLANGALGTIDMGQKNN